MGYKKQRIGPRIVDAARSGDRYRDVHVFIGGTGAVGGTALLQMIDFYEEMMTIRAPEPDAVPVLAATGRNAADIEQFRQRLHRFLESRSGGPGAAETSACGTLTRSGILITMEPFELTPLPGLERLRQLPDSEKAPFVNALLSRLLGTPCSSPDQALACFLKAFRGAQPISGFLKRYRETLPQRPERFRSVIIGIPIPSLIAYHLDHLTEAAAQIPGLTRSQVDLLREAFLEAFRDDLAHVQTALADALLVAHTTAVGGMYDESMTERGPMRAIRLGFAHSALDTRLKDKQRFAEELAEAYAAIGIKMLITAAAIGIDAVRMHETIPLHFQIREKLSHTPIAFVPSPGEMNEDSAETVRICRPITVPLEQPPEEPSAFALGTALRPAHAIRSGENGFFTVSNADALYRVMRIASASELAMVLTSVALLGDDPASPWFPGNVCYYTETDNSRQVFDFLYQPRLMESQLSGLDPLALQDLGSAKHQGELHTLGLLILLNRLRTFDTGAIDPYADLERFDAERVFLEHSRPLTFEALDRWTLEATAADLAILVGADAPEDLLPLLASAPSALFPRKSLALQRILERVLQAVWAIPSLGSPILFERRGEALVRAGYFIAPLDILLTRQDAIDSALSDLHRRSGNPCTFEEFRDHHVCTGGFIDLRPSAILCTAKYDHLDLRGQVQRFSDTEGLRAALKRLEPYSFFSTCGLMALFLRLKGLYKQLHVAMAELGTLQDYRWQMPRDTSGHLLLVPGAVEAFRMVAEGLEKATGTERLDGIWGYEPRQAPWRRLEGQ